jgi:hypothetical protein
MSSVFDYILYLPTAALVFVFALTLVAKFQPYKNKRKNTVDIILLLIVITGFTSSSMSYAGKFMYPRWLIEIIVGISTSIISGYLVFLILSCVLPQTVRCYKKCRTHLMSKIKMSEVNEEDGALLNHGSSDYNSYS